LVRLDSRFDKSALRRINYIFPQLAFGYAEQLTAAVIRPTVIGALKVSRVAGGLLRKDRTAMPATVEKNSRGHPLIADHDYRIIAD
jgi:hypothetical protein